MNSKQKEIRHNVRFDEKLLKFGMALGQMVRCWNDLINELQNIPNCARMMDEDRS